VAAEPEGMSHLVGHRVVVARLRHLLVTPPLRDAQHPHGYS
jgi:hypothetical protein